MGNEELKQVGIEAVKALILLVLQAASRAKMTATELDALYIQQADEFKKNDPSLIPEV